MQDRRKMTEYVRVLHIKEFYKIFIDISIKNIIYEYFNYTENDMA